MLVLAMAPPFPLGGKIFIALLMLGMIGMLLRAVRGVSLTGRSIGLAIAAAVAAVVVLEKMFPGSYGGGFHNLGVLAAGIGAISGAALLRPTRQVNHRATSRGLRLVALTFISGPLVGLVLASLTVLLSDVSPMDRGYTFEVFTLIGLLAGLIGVLVVAAALTSRSFCSSESDEQP
ncbi:MAG: hypothetical protein O2955_11515 [Planctomycetota bacterium]|nr:hypothetical protein [Planctomycetota bacterium]MDA1213142.1 hypothetical protein [Planctomycetota bacterium]